MKHIRKKFQIEFDLTEEEMELIKKDARHVEYTDLANLKINKETYAVLFTDKNTGIYGFPYKPKGGKQYVIPEPDPILIYYNIAYFSYIKIEEAKDNLFKALQAETVSEKVINDLYNYYSLSTTFVILLFTAIEGFFNRAIPHDFEHVDKQNKKTETFNREQIQRFLSFEIKSKSIIPKVFGKDFAKQFEIKWTRIMNLKKLRDEIVHTKDNTKAGVLFEHLYKPSLNFHYKETLMSVQDLFNYYKPGYIEDCPCNDPI